MALAWFCFFCWLFPVGAKISVTVPKTVEVYEGGMAEIPCQYAFTGKPNGVLSQVFAAPTSSADPLLAICRDLVVEPNTDYTNRIEVIPEGQGGFRLIIKDVQVSDNRLFHFEIIDPGVTSQWNKTELKVFAPPEAPVIEGGPSVVLPATSEMLSKVASCKTQNGFPEPNITWYRNCMQLMDDPGLLTRETQSSGYYSTQSTLEYKVTKEDNEAKFSCEVSYSVPGGIKTIMSDSINIPVHYLDPVVLEHKGSPAVFKGKDLTLTCNAQSSHETSTVWYKDGERVGQGNTFHLQDATYEDSGDYRCEVSVPSVPTLHTSGSFDIRVQGAPEIWGKKYVSQQETIGNTLELSCEAGGNPLPSITWEMTGSQTWQEVEKKESEYRTHSMKSGRMSSDVVTVAICFASNTWGSDVKVFYIKPIISRPDEWTMFGQRCFLYISRPLTWAEAERTCISKGGNLASVRTTGEIDFIRSLIYGVSGRHKETWVGGHDAVKDGIWLWSDGSKFDFNSWGPGQPDNAKGMEHCMEMNWRGSFINDNRCYRRLPFVCAKDP